MRFNAIHVLWCVLAVVAAVSLAGCSHKDDMDSPDTSKASTTAPTGGGSQQGLEAKPQRPHLGEDK